MFLTIIILQKDGYAVSCFVNHEKERILCVDPCLNIGEIRDAYGILNLLSTQFKSLKIILSMDLWLNRDRSEKEIVDFFRGK